MSNFSSRRRSLRWTVSGLVLFTLSVPCSKLAFAQKLRVRAHTHIEPHRTVRGGKTSLYGTMSDDAKAPVAEPLRVRIALPDGSVERNVSDCEKKTNLTIEGDELSIAPDAMGHFCLNIESALKNTGLVRARFRFAPKAGSLFDASDTELAFEPEKSSVALSFRSTESVVRLRDSTFLAQVLALGDDDKPLTGLAIDLAIEGRALGRSNTNDLGLAEFRIPAGQLGDPGTALLEARFSGNDRFNEDRTSLKIEKRTTVELQVEAATLSALEQGVSPEDGISIGVKLSSSHASSIDGLVELLADGATVGAGKVEQSEAVVDARFVPAGKSVSLELVFRPSSPGFEPSRSRPFLLRVAPPPRWRIVPFVLGIAALGAFLFRDWRPRRKAGSAQDETPKTSPMKSAGVQMIRKIGDGSLSGKVFDAHAATPVAKARVWLEDLSRRGVPLLSTEADELGQFRLEPGVDAGRKLVLCAESPFHRMLERTIHASGEYEIGLITRKRALLEHLVGWAKRKGRPFDQDPEATPGHIALVGRGSDVAAWATKVEFAAYSEVAIDARTEAETLQGAPNDASIVPADHTSPDLVPGLQQPYVDSAPDVTSGLPKRVDRTRKGFG